MNIHSRFRSSLMSWTIIFCTFVFMSRVTIDLSAAEGGTLYGIESGNLVRIDLVNHEITELGSTGFFAVGAMTYNSSLQSLFAIGIDDQLDRKLIRIDKRTGVGTEVGSIGFEFESQLAYDAVTNRFYSTSRSRSGGPTSLITIDTVTGAGTVVGQTGYGGITGLAIDSSTNELLGIGTPVNTFDSELIEFDSTTGVATPRGAFEFATRGFSQALTYDSVSDDLLVSLPGFVDPFLGDFSQVVLRVNKQTGSQVSFNSFSPNVSIGALAFVPNTIPEPNSTCVLTIGLAFTVLKRRRQPVFDRLLPCHSG